MENNEIKAIIDKYNLVRIGDKVAAQRTKGVDRDTFIREVGPHKAEILAYFAAQEKVAADLLAKRKATFEAIPGVKELRAARQQYSAAHRNLSRIVESGDSVFPAWNAPTSAEVENMEKRYPMAVFALEVESKATYSLNYELAAIYKETYNALCDGQAPDAVKAAHDLRMHEFAMQHI